MTWRVSMHGGHSGTYCDHARASLAEVLEAAATRGFVSYGVSEHAPRMDPTLLYAEEVRRGWTVGTTVALFDAYFAEARRLQRAWEGRLQVWVGFESEATPGEGWVQQTAAWRERYEPDYVVGSVHHVRGRSIDGPVCELESLVGEVGSLERVACEYYRTVLRVVQEVKPSVVGHLDLVRKNGRLLGDVETVAVREAAFEVLEAIAQAGEDGPVLDLNVAALRKGLREPYPAGWLVRRAAELGVGFVLGDDSHGPDEVGDGLEAGAEYLRAHGVRSVRVPVSRGGRMVWEDAGL